ncbi:MAG TPA: BsuPI-related putative proteinase inhibitor [Nonomuraea sp.]|nr:BsuPI-related putative proteinase inhibitor [Nonomuraea sp.]
MRSSWTFVSALATLLVLTPSFSQALAADPLQVSLTTDKASYNRGESAQLTLRVTNTGLTPVVVTFNTSQKYDFAALDSSGVTAWTWSQGQVFNPAPSQQTLAPGASWTFTASWAFTTNLGERLADGSYTIRGTFTGQYLGRAGAKTADQAITYFTPDYLQVTFSTDKTTYRWLDTAKMNLRVLNVAPYPLTITFSNGQLYDFSVASSNGSTLWNWAYGKTFSPDPVELVLNPNEAVEFQVSWNLAGNNGLPVSAGTYTASGIFLGNYEGKSGPKGGSSEIRITTL